MGRYRPPPPRSSKYITPEGAARLRAEVDYLWKTKRPEVTRAVAEAAAQGDRSENAEYIYGKRQLAEIDRRLRFLRKRLDGMRVVDCPPTDTDRVYFGAWFEIADGRRRRRYRLVGPDELGDGEGYVSLDSPLGKAVIGKRVGDEIVVSTPDAEHGYEITTVSYAPPPGKKKPGTRPGESQGEN
jgi:transcription elongation factor GreB